jgi:hypothetical protein
MSTKTAYLSDQLVKAILQMADLHIHIPELKQYAAAYLKEGQSRGGCSSCRRKKATEGVLAATRQLITNLPQAKLDRLKARIGVSGDLRVLYRSEQGFQTKIL